MANVDRPCGLRPIGTINGSPWNANVRARPVDASNSTAIFVGDAIILEDDGNVAPYTGTGGGNLLGVCVGVVVSRAVAATEHPGYLPATTAGTILVVEGPDTLFEIQDDGEAVPTTAIIGTNGDVQATAGSTTTGMSAHELDMGTVTTLDASAATAQLRVVDYMHREDNDPAAVNAKWIVRINEHTHRETTGL